MPRSVWAFEHREGVGDEEEYNGWGDGGREFRTVEGAC